jgi:hypothetical protein
MGFGYLVSDRSGGLFNLALSDGGSILVMAQPGGGLDSGVGALIFPTIAAMAAFDVSTILPEPQNGQQAFVQSNGSLWTLRGSELTPDGITVVDGTGVPFAQWLRENVSGYLPGPLQQTAWYIDPQNVSGTASDENDGLTNTTPIKTKAEIFRRWGYTWAATLDALNVVMTQMSPDTAGDGAGHDPGQFAPTFTNGATLTYIANLPAPSFTGTLLAVTPKNTASAATCTPLRSTFTVLTGAVATNMMLVNATRGNSRAFAQRNTGGGLWQISQPFAPQTGTGFYGAAEVDTWANGDAITGYALMAVDLARVGGLTAETQTGLAGPSFIVQQLSFLDPDGSGFDATDFNCTALLGVQECSFSRSISIQGNTGISSMFANCASFADGVVVCTALGTIWTGGLLQGFALTFDATFGAVQQNTIVACSSAQFTDASLVTFALDAGTVLTLFDSTTLSGVIYGVHGSLGIINAQGPVKYPTGAVANLQASLQIAAQGNAYSNVSPAGVTAVHLLALTPTALDAGAGAAGFGGLAYVPGVGSFYDGATP